MSLNVHYRRSTRLQSWDYTWPWWYYVTICAYKRQCIFGNIVNNKVQLNDHGRIVREEWMKTPTIRPEIALDDFVIMPNHVHGIVIIKGNSVGATGSVALNGTEGRDTSTATRRVAQIVDQERASQRLAPTKALVSGSLGAIMGQFKSKTAKRINVMRGTKGASVWQRNYHDHIIRNEADLHRIRTYIGNNPLQWALDEENPDNHT